MVPSRHSSPTTRKALFLAGGYVLIVLIWIGGINWISAGIQDPDRQTLLQVIQDIGLVLAPAMVLIILVRQHLTTITQSQEHARRLAEHMQNLLLFYNLDRQLVYVTPACTDLTGYSTDECYRMQFMQFVAAQDRDHVQAHLGALFAGRGECTFEFRLVTKDGSEKWVQASGGPMNDATGKSVGFYINQYDITQCKTTQELLHQAQVHLLQNERLVTLGRLTADTAHELSNPMTSILGYAELLLLNDLPDEIREDIAMIETHAQRACQIVTNLLKFARQRAAERALTDINDVITRTLELRAHHLKVHNIEIILLLSHDLPRVLVDPFQLQQVLLNLIVNAEQALNDPIWRTHSFHPARLTIETATHCDTPDTEDQIIIRVYDNGPGIASNIRERIFEPFFTTKEQGNGLGLSIAAEIVRDHGGQMQVRGKAGRGTTMEIRLPVFTGSTQEASSELNMNRSLQQPGTCVAVE